MGMEKGQPVARPIVSKGTRIIRSGSSSSCLTFIITMSSTCSSFNRRLHSDHPNPNPEITIAHIHQEEAIPHSASTSSLVGTCQFMCPVQERVQRERLQDLSVFERLNGSPRQTSPSLAVKKFCRSISTKHVEPLNVRPLSVLENTLNYLLMLLESEEHPFEVVHEFVFDRTRSIRQDLVMQNIINDRSIQMFEKMVKFHVISHQKLRRGSSGSDISSMYYLNMEQLTKVIMSLYQLYEANQSPLSIHENEAEFRSLYVLLHLGSSGKAMVLHSTMGESLSLWLRRVTSPIIKSKEMHFARILLRSFRLGYYKRFIHTAAAGASHLQYCIIEPYINKARALALCCVNYGGHKHYPYPLADLSKLLMMEEVDTESFCHDCGLETLRDAAGNKLLPTKQTTFSYPKGEFPN